MGIVASTIHLIHQPLSDRRSSPAVRCRVSHGLVIIKLCQTGNHALAEGTSQAGQADPDAVISGYEARHQHKGDSHTVSGALWEALTI